MSYKLVSEQNFYFIFINYILLWLFLKWIQTARATPLNKKKRMFDVGQITFRTVCNAPLLYWNASRTLTLLYWQPQHHSLPERIVCIMAALRLQSLQWVKSCKYIENSRLYSSTTTATGLRALVNKVVTTSDNKTYVAWHPTEDFPYEKSRPLPPSAEASSSIIKDTAVQNAMRAFGTKHPEIARQELSKATFTTKHRWYPRARDKKAKKTPMDREFL